MALRPRELEVLRLVAQGLERIARRLVLSEHTGRRFVASILRKFSLNSRAAAVGGTRPAV